MKKLFLLFFVIQSSPGHAGSYTDSLIREAAKAGNTGKKVNLLDQISFAFSTADPAKGIQYANEALDLAKQIGYTKGVAAANADLGINYAARSEYGKARFYDSAALAQYTALGEEKSVAGVLANLSLLYMSQGKYPKALEYGFKALKIHEERKDEANKAIVLENIGTIYLEQKDYLKTAEYYDLAYASYKKLNNIEGMARNRGNEGIVQDALGHYDRALSFHKEALEINRRLGLEQSVQINLVNVGIVYCHMGDYASALGYQFEALRLSEKLDNTAGIAVNAGNIGETYYFIATDSSQDPVPGEFVMKGRTANMHKAAEYLGRSVTLCRSIKFWGPLVEFSDYLAKALYSIGEYKEAYAAHLEYMAVKDSVFSQESKMQLSRLETEREMMLKNKQIEIEKLKQVNSRNEKIGYIASLALLLIAIVFMYFELKRRRREGNTINRLNAELNRNVKQLEITNKELEAFSYSVSHDLRAPLRAVGGYIRIMSEDHHEVLNEDCKRLLSIIQENASRMGILIDELLEFSKLGRKEIQKTDIDTAMLIKEVISRIESLMKHRAEIKTGYLHDVCADRGLLFQALFNLMSNAVKYSSKKEKPVIEISSRIETAEIVFTIKDNGSGFDMNYADKLFGVFQRLHSQEEFEGAGVGLAIVERVISKHGGRVWAEGVSGEGATFYFSLPAKEAA